MTAVALAQSEVTTETFDLDENGVAINEIGNGSFAEVPLGTVPCFDYYSFGSVQANLITSVATAVTGTDLYFTGTLSNSNDYPVVDGTLYVKIFKGQDSENDGNGPDVVDQYAALTNLSIPANGTIPVSFTWSIPSNAVTGQYELATFFVTSERFNLHGLSFTDDIVGAAVPFYVDGERADYVAFDKTSVTVDGEKYFFASAPPRVDSRAPIQIKAQVVNDTDHDEGAVISWEVYQWDAQSPANLVETVNPTRVQIPAGESVPVAFAVTDTDFPVYLIVGTLRWKDTTSILNIRVARAGSDTVRINYPSLSAFPLAAGISNNLFSCLHSVGSSDSVGNGELELVLRDRHSEIIHQYSYNGDITSSMLGVASAFIPDSNYDFVELNAKLLRDGEIVDDVTVIYDCEAIDPSSCLGESDNEPITSDPSATRSHIYLFLGLSTIIVLIVMAGLLVMYRHRKSIDV